MTGLTSWTRRRTPVAAALFDDAMVGFAAAAGMRLEAYTEMILEPPR